MPMFLSALATESHPDHSKAVTRFEQELQAQEAIALAFSVAAEFLHAVTDPRRLTPPLPMSEAIRWLRDFSSEINPIWLGTTEEARDQWLSWMTELKLGRKRILDTQFAAILKVNGVERLLTNNSADFQIFGAFELISF